MNKKTKNILEWILCILIAFVLALLIKYYIGTPTVVKKVSMYPTLKENDRLILNRWTRTTKQIPNRGDIITFEAPDNIENYQDKEESNYNSLIAKYENEPTSWWEKFCYYVLEIGKDSYIKRVIGLPGDHIQIINGKVYLNGEELQENYLQEGVTTEVTGKEDYYFDVIVPENCIFAMGDNRRQSTDCRKFGCIPIDKIESIVWIRFFPFDKIGKVN